MNQNINSDKLKELAECLINIKNNTEKALEIINLNPNKTLDIEKIKNINISEYFEDENKVIEGIFNGEIMIGPDGKQYSIPANYISKTKILEGDKLKLTIKKDGTFLYKQIEQAKRQRATGILSKDETSKGFVVLVNSKLYKVQKASVTYFKGEIGNKAIVLIPEDKNATWAAIENIEINNTKVNESKSTITPISLDDIEIN